MLLIFFPNDPYTPQASLEKIIVCIRPRDSLFNNLPWDGPNHRHTERDNVFVPGLDTFLESAPFRTSLRQRLLGSTQIRKRKTERCPRPCGFRAFRRRCAVDGHLGQRVHALRAPRSLSRRLQRTGLPPPDMCAQEVSM